MLKFISSWRVQKTLPSRIFSKPIFMPISLVVHVSFAGGLNRQRSTLATKEVHTTDSKTKKSAMATNLHLAASLSPLAIPRVTLRSSSRIYGRTGYVLKRRGNAKGIQESDR